MRIQKSIVEIKRRQDWWAREEANSVATTPDRGIYRGAKFAFDECLGVLEKAEVEEREDRKKAVLPRLSREALHRAAVLALRRLKHGCPRDARRILQQAVGD